MRRDQRHVVVGAVDQSDEELFELLIQQAALGDGVL
jgi:hypothetical protein